MKHLPSWQNNKLISNISKSAPKAKNAKKLGGEKERWLSSENQRKPKKTFKRRDGCLQNTKGKPKENQSRDGCLEKTNPSALGNIKKGGITLTDPKKILD